MNSSPLLIGADTNIFVSGLLFGGAPGRILSLGTNSFLRLVVSKEIVREYLKVLAYPMFKLNRTEITLIIEQVILPIAEVVDVMKAPPVIQEDHADDKFLAAASQGRADAIVSGDRHLLGLKAYKGIPIETAADFLKRFEASKLTKPQQG